MSKAYCTTFFCFLLIDQSMFLEIEQKVAFLSDLAQQEEAWCQEGTASTHQEAEALSSKLEGLKSSLVKFQMLLQERHNEEQVQHLLLSLPLSLASLQ